MRKLVSVGPEAKSFRLNPYKRIKTGTEVTVKIGGEDVVAVRDRPGKYSYLAVNGVDYYVSLPLQGGEEFTVVDVEDKPVVEGAEPKKRGRKPKSALEQPAAA